MRGGVAPRCSLTRDVDRKTIFVLDEAWAILSNLGIAKWLQASFKLSRARGLQNIAVMHRFSDLAATGAQGSQQERVARGLLSDTETKVVYAQPHGRDRGDTRPSRSDRDRGRTAAAARAGRRSVEGR